MCGRVAAPLHEGLPCESALLSWAGPPWSVGGGEGKLKPPSLSCDLGSIDAISMLTSAQETRNGSSPTGRMRRRDSEAPTENPTVLQSHLPKTKESAPRSLPSAPQAPFVKNPSQAKFLLRLSCRSLHFGLCFSPPSRSSNLPCLWKCLRRLRPPQTRPRHLPRRPHHLEKTGRSRKWRWKMRGVRSHLPQEQRKMLP